jgi:glycosyltransferase involved in cell wall biosynthesis
MKRIAVVFWSGALGGAETFTVDLCRAMRTLGAEVGVVFVTNDAPLGDRLEAAGIEQTSLGLDRGRDIVRHPRALARSVGALGPGGALLPRAGYLTAALRLGGYQRRTVAVAHDAVFGLGPVSARERFIWQVDHLSGYWASDIDVAVSDFALSHMRRQRHARRLVRIYNGVDLDLYDGAPRADARSVITIACAGRLIEGKGIDVLLRAFASGVADAGACLRIAGEGPTRPHLERLAHELSLNDVVEFIGPIVDMPSFWRDCDIATQPSADFVESFGMAAVEAMASGRPVVVTANGALPEVVSNGVTGAVVDPGDVNALAESLLELVRDQPRRGAAGAAGRARCEELFDLRDCAAAYLRLFDGD